MTPRDRINKILSEIEAREKAATPGPWGVDSVSEVTSTDGDVCWQLSLLNTKPNAEFIASSRTTIPRLREALSYILMRGESGFFHHELEEIADILEGKHE